MANKMLARVKRGARIRGGGVTRVSNGVWRLKWRIGGGDRENYGAGGGPDLGQAVRRMSQERESPSM